jgi:type VI secretion system Hcp family effector
MAYQAYASIKGAKQGQLKGGSMDPKHFRWIEIVAFKSEVKAPRDASAGQASGKRQHKPIRFTVAFGAATPQLLQARATNEVLSQVIIEIVDLSAPGNEPQVRRIILNQAKIVDVRPHVGAASPGQVLSDFTFEYGGFEYGGIRGFEYGGIRGA